MDIIRNPYAIVALGGYGRSEQCLHSDIDLLVLFEKKIPAQADALIREMIYPLWDIGMEVGYATRSLKECLRLAADDYDILTPILDARFICGMSPLFSTLMDRIARDGYQEEIPQNHSSGLSRKTTIVMSISGIRPTCWSPI